MDSPTAGVSIWNTVQELVSLEKDIYRSVNDREGKDGDGVEAWRTGYREHLRSKALKRQQLLESLERGLKSCGWDTLRHIQIGTTSVLLPEKDECISINNDALKPQTEAVHELERKDLVESPKRELDSVACKLNFETAESLDKASCQYQTRLDKHVTNEQDLEREYVQLERQYHHVLAEKEALEQNCSRLENLIQIQRKHMEYYVKELEKMTERFCLPRKEKVKIMDESDKENQSCNTDKCILRNKSPELEHITGVMQQQMQIQVDDLQQQKEDLEITIEKLQTFKQELQTYIRKLEDGVQKLEEKKRIALNSLQTMFQQIQTEVSRCRQSKYQVTHLATDVVNTIFSDGNNGHVEASESATTNTNTITVKAISKLQEKVYMLQDALAQSQEETNRYKKALFALREEHERTIQRNSKEFKVLIQELHQLKQQHKHKKQSQLKVLSSLR